MAHENTMIGRTGVRVLEDGCDTCLRSLTYCDAVTYLDGPGIRCCTACSH